MDYPPDAIREYIGSQRYFYETDFGGLQSIVEEINRIAEGDVKITNAVGFSKDGIVTVEFDYEILGKNKHHKYSEPWQWELSSPIVVRMFNDVLPINSEKYFFDVSSDVEGIVYGTWEEELYLFQNNIIHRGIDDYNAKNAFPDFYNKYTEAGYKYNL